MFKTLKLGDLIVVYNSKLVTHVGKLKLRRVEPYRIVKAIAQGTLLLSNLHKNPIPKPINNFPLKSYYSPDAPQRAI